MDNRRPGKERALIQVKPFSALLDHHHPGQCVPPSIVSLSQPNTDSVECFFH